MLDTTQDLNTCAEELKVDRSCVGQLITPLTRYTNRSTHLWAMDNGCFSTYNEPSFRALLKRELPNRAGCRFVAVPDVVGSARRTLELWAAFHHTSMFDGWPLALVMQDGMEDFPIPWGSISAVFIGGSTAWKCSQHARAICNAAKMLGKWVHVGRVNTADRLEIVDEFGADSVDGTGLSRYTHMRNAIAVTNTQTRIDWLV